MVQYFKLHYTTNEPTHSQSQNFTRPIKQLLSQLNCRYFFEEPIFHMKNIIHTPKAFKKTIYT